MKILGLSGSPRKESQSGVYKLVQTVLENTGIVYEKIHMLAQSDVTVLIRGETGTGKALAAHAIHKLSRRRRLNMTTVNCPALPETILESELFGYRKGAFTDAVENRNGLFDQANGGSISARICFTA